ncbi:hypothetical protein PCYB_103030 [Plasmodium cynomolgi strain B]|uniref:Uncharacterized protein n=1 Tax=Plasmodium cynomolgi (strain B) TaxID=1120755 RepID=K6UKL7_PLACD|nr:hypothetical protein PCYB_103030 [Plasmodium cynomolgi strain B]GAB66953.1 hypothetical protein PCYB_103030 [Plasmodium cynomolgi strain B]
MQVTEEPLIAAALLNQTRTPPFRRNIDEEHKGSAGTFALSNEPIYYAPSGGLAPCAVISRQLSGHEEDSGEDGAEVGGEDGVEDSAEDRDDDDGLPEGRFPYEEGKKSGLVRDTPSHHLDGDEDEHTAEDGGAKRKMSKKEEEAEDNKIDELVNAEMKKHEAEEEPDKDPDAEPEKEDQGSGQGRRPKLRCANKLNYIQVTGNGQREEDLFGENDEEGAPAFVEIPHKIKEDIDGMTTKHNEREEAGEAEEAHDRIDRAENENNANDTKFVEGNAYMQEGEQHSEDSTGPIGERERERSSSPSNGYTQNSFVDLKTVSDKLPLNYTNSFDNPLFHNKLEKTVQKHLPWPVLASNSGSNGGSWADVNSSTYNVSPFSFASIHTRNALHLMPMNFQVQNSIVKLSDEVYDKLNLKNSVNVYDNNELVAYKYENFEVKEGEEYNNGDKMNEEKNGEGASGGEGGSDGEGNSDGEGDADSKSDQNNGSDGRGFFDGTLVTYTIVILIGVIIVLLCFVIYYYDLINKVKRRMSAKRKNNKSMTIANNTSAGMYRDDTYKESAHV